MTPLPPPDPKFIHCPLCGQQTCDHKPTIVKRVTYRADTALVDGNPVVTKVEVCEEVLEWVDDLYVPVLLADGRATGAYEKAADAKSRLDAEDASVKGDSEKTAEAVWSYFRQTHGWALLEGRNLYTAKEYLRHLYGIGYGDGSAGLLESLNDFLVGKARSLYGDQGPKNPYPEFVPLPPLNSDDEEDDEDSEQNTGSEDSTSDPTEK